MEKSGPASEGWQQEAHCYQSLVYCFPSCCPQPIYTQPEAKTGDGTEIRVEEMERGWMIHMEWPPGDSEEEVGPTEGAFPEWGVSSCTLPRALGGGGPDSWVNSWGKTNQSNLQ